MLDVAAIKLNDHSIIHAVLENSGLLEKNISKDMLYVCDFGKLIQTKYQGQSSICRKERENSMQHLILL